MASELGKRLYGHIFRIKTQARRPHRVIEPVQRLVDKRKLGPVSGLPLRKQRSGNVL